MYILGHQKYQEGDTTKYLEWLSLDGRISGDYLLFFFSFSLLRFNYHVFFHNLKTKY